MKTKTKSEQTNTMVVVASLQKQAQPFIKQLGGIATINSKAEFKEAAEKIKKLKILAQSAEVEEKKITQPLNDALKATREHFRPFKNLVGEWEQKIKLLMSVFVEKQKKVAAKVEDDFANGKIKKLSTAQNKMAAVTPENTDSVQVRKVWQLRIVDENKIPREFMVPNESAIKAAFKNGSKVPGCVWEQVESIAI